MIDEEDLRVDIYITGSHKAARITHIPTGLVGTSESNTSYTRAKAEAMANLEAKLEETMDFELRKGDKVILTNQAPKKRPFWQWLLRKKPKTDDGVYTVVEVNQI